MSPRISKLLEAFRKSEGTKNRGPRFKKLALAIEKEMHQPGVTEEVILECFGASDLRYPGLFVYYFDHFTAGENRDEWYFIFDNQKLNNSGYNARGIIRFPINLRARRCLHRRS